ncbi:MAG TPA: cation-translocating P-type ATPase [Dehalococcoidia bacterium]|nr:cation-translocating P-type ATPase [Dehalococcoidia bacterium]
MGPDSEPVHLQDPWTEAEARAGDEGARRPWHALTAAEVLSVLGVSPGAGLSAAEAARRLRDLGPNLAPAARGRPATLLLLAQFRSILVYVLLVAGAVSLALGDTFEAAAIGAIVLLNAMLGFAQEYRSQRALEALRSMVAPEATVLRDGRPARMPAAGIVPGDIVLLESGDIVPADGRIIEAASLQVSEALLTGESTPVDKGPDPVGLDAVLADRTSMVFQGTVVTSGRGACVVVSTGSQTEMGRIAGLIAAPKEEMTPLQQRLEGVGHFLLFGALLLCVLVFVIGVARGIDAGEMFLTATSLAVAAIPEGLPAATTLVLAIGVQRMASQNAIVRRLSSVETLGSVTVIFTDKTGTLTENRMTVERLWTPDGREEALLAAVLCNNARLGGDGEPEIGDPTEIALLAFALKSGLDPEAARRDHPRLSEIPFDSSRARMTVTVGGPDGRRAAYMKGAPEVVLPLCDISPAGAEEEAARMASDGLRVLALARRDVTQKDDPDIERGMRLVGLAGLWDPLRPEAPAALRQAAAAGVRVVMLTGDHPATARAIAARLGLEGDVLTGREIEALDPDELRVRAAGATVFARVTSEHKLRIVEAARRGGEVTAMTGDGVNDAPALRAADIGIAMGLGGTDVAREAADMVLVDNRFATIVEAMRQGRAIYANIQRFVHFLLSCNLAEVAVIFIALLVWSASPLTPLQILFVNLLTDGLPALALGLEPVDPMTMTRPPRRPGAGIISKRSLMPIVGVGGVVAACTLVGYALGREWGGAALGRDMALATLVGAHLAVAFVFRNESRPFFALRANHWLTAAVASSALLLVGLYEAPFLSERLDVHSLAWKHMAVVAALSLAPLAVGEAAKVSGVLRRAGLLPEGV